MNWLDEKELLELSIKRDYTVAIANEVLDTMRMGLSAQQQDILDFMLKEIKPDDVPETRYAIAIGDYCRVHGISYSKGGKNYQDVKNSIKALNNNCKWIKTDKHTSALIYWFKNITIDTDKGIIEYNIDDTMCPYLFDLVKKGHFAGWRDRFPAAMRGRYSKHLYKILMRYLGAKIYKPLIPIDKLKMLIEAENYTRYPDFRRYVLDAAKEEINKYTLMKMDYEPKKEAGSRGYTHIEFTISELALKVDGEGMERMRNNMEAYGDGEEELYPQFKGGN